MSSSTMTIYCIQCGGENRSEAQFCRFCGHALGAKGFEQFSNQNEGQSQIVVGLKDPQTIRVDQPASGSETAPAPQTADAPTVKIGSEYSRSEYSRSEDAPQPEAPLVETEMEAGRVLSHPQSEMPLVETGTEDERVLSHPQPGPTTLLEAAADQEPAAPASIPTGSIASLEDSSAISEQTTPVIQIPIDTPEIPASEYSRSSEPLVEESPTQETETEALAEGQDEPDQTEAASRGILPANTVLQNRFRIVGLISEYSRSEYSRSEDEQGVLYEAVDLLRCWSCQTVQTQSGMRFCEVCGAELSQQPVVHLRAVPVEQPEKYREVQNEWIQEGEWVYLVEIPIQPPAAGDKPPRIRQVSGFISDVGQVREIDEDSLLVLHLDGLCEMANAPTLGFFAVADGIGGHDAGEVASRVAVHSLAAQVMNYIFSAELGGVLSPIEELADRLQTAILAANQAILDLRESLGGSNMGCTLTAALVRGASAVVANVGDSRTYWMHEGHLEQVTRDHSMAARLVEQNLMRPEEIYAFEQKSVIYRSLGDNPSLTVDMTTVELSVGDRLLLCSDGLWDMVRDPFIEDVLLEQVDPQQASERLVELANMAGGEDNITVIVVEIRSPA